MKFGELRGQVLCEKAVSNTTAVRFRKLLAAFDVYVMRVHRTKATTLTPGPAMDSIGAEYFEELFWEGRAPHEASTTFAALDWRHPSTSRHGTTAMPA